MKKSLKTLAVKLSVLALMVGFVGGTMGAIDPPGGGQMRIGIRVQAIDPPGGSAW